MGLLFQEKNQNDLFEQLNTADKKINKKTRFIFPRLKDNLRLSYENLIFFVIFFIMSCIIFFSLGVEKGRRDVYIKGKSNFVQEVSIAKLSEQKKDNIASESPKRKEPLVQEEGNYIIQLAAFKTELSAENAKNNLNKRGYKASIKKSGEYYQVYIGSFAERKDAYKIQQELTKLYNDCYIKKL